jgi:signal transduction histidine kinase
MSSKQNCYRLLRLINNIIDITKMDSGFFHSNFQCKNIVSVVEEITQSIADYAKNKGICIIFDTDVEEKNTLCDADAIERIILNLISNAIKFTDEGGNINVTLKDMNSYIEIMVEDNGIGIPEEQLPLIFNRFKQVDKSLARRQEGSGIGLSIVKSLVEMHEGTIELFSEVGKGTKFTIKLPTKNSCSIDEIAADRELYDSKVEKINIEFSDIYF